MARHGALPEGESARFQKAVGSADVEAVRLLIDAGVDVNKSADGLTPLMTACLSCDNNPKKEKIVDLLLAAGADPNIQSGTDEGDSGLTALMYAAESGNLEMIQRLLAAGADAKVLTKRGRSAINLALERMYNHADTIAVLRALVDAGCPAAGSCLVGPVGEGNLEITRILIAAGADVNATTNKFDEFRRSGAGVTLVSLAVGGAINAEKEKGMTGYDSEARARYVQILNALVQAGANVNQPGAGMPPLTAAAVYGEDMELVMLLLKLRADPNGRVNNRLATALHAAAGYGHVEVARMLVKAGAEVNAMAPRNQTPLDEATQNERVEVAAFLTSVGGKRGAELSSAERK